jgi:hypothetical protein
MSYGTDKTRLNYNILILLKNYFGMLHAIYEGNTANRRQRMRWMETIRVQSATGKEHAIEHELIALDREVQENPERQGLREAAVWSHATVPGCFALRLFWDTDDPQPSGSPLGMSLAQSLKAFGLVDHSVWIEAGNE